MQIKLVVRIIIAICVADFIVTRITAVNAPWASRKTKYFEIGETVALERTLSTGESVHNGDMTILADQPTIIDVNRLSDINIEYTDPLLSSGNAHAAWAILIPLTISNGAARAISLPLMDFNLQSGAWTNGTDPNLFEAINPSVGMVSQLAAHSALHVTMPFIVYDITCPSYTDFQNMTKKNYELLLSLLPNRCSIVFETKLINASK